MHVGSEGGLPERGPPWVAAKATKLPGVREMEKKGIMCERSSTRQPCTGVRHLVGT